MKVKAPSVPAGISADQYMVDRLRAMRTELVTMQVLLRQSWRENRNCETNRINGQLKSVAAMLRNAEEYLGRSLHSFRAHARPDQPLSQDRHLTDGLPVAHGEGSQAKA